MLILALEQQAQRSLSSHFSMLSAMSSFTRSRCILSTTGATAIFAATVAQDHPLGDLPPLVIPEGAVVLDFGPTIDSSEIYSKSTCVASHTCDSDDRPIELRGYGCNRPSRPPESVFVELPVTELGVAGVASRDRMRQLTPQTHMCGPGSHMCEPEETTGYASRSPATLRVADHFPDCRKMVSEQRKPLGRNDLRQNCTCTNEPQLQFFRPSHARCDIVTQRVTPPSGQPVMTGHDRSETPQPFGHRLDSFFSHPPARRVALQANARAGVVFDQPALVGGSLLHPALSLGTVGEGFLSWGKAWLLVTQQTR